MRHPLELRQVRQRPGEDREQDRGDRPQQEARRHRLAGHAARERPMPGTDRPRDDRRRTGGDRHRDEVHKPEDVSDSPHRRRRGRCLGLQVSGQIGVRQPHQHVQDVLCQDRERQQYQRPKNAILLIRQRPR